jgi:phosphatidylcholine synthase
MDVRRCQESPTGRIRCNHMTMLSPSLIRARAYAVHVMTASGVVAAFLALAELFAEVPDERVVLVWLAVAVVIDAVDGPLARAWDVKRLAPHIDGRTIDDIVDYLTFTFVPLLLVWRMGWVPFAPSLPGATWIVPALVASLLGFANVGAKDEAAWYFRGFPSYWNIAAFYAGLSFHALGGTGRWLNGVVLLALAVLTVSPLRFLYPNLAPRPWRLPVMLGAAAWLALMLGMLLIYRSVPAWVVAVSLVYPAFYVTLSIVLDPQRHGRVGDNPT